VSKSVQTCTNSIFYVSLMHSKNQMRDLKVLVQKVYGSPLHYGNECKRLSDSILKHSNEYISYQTLRRFFGFIKTTQPATIHTLNILSRYCGYNNYEDYLAQISKEKSNETDFVKLIFTIPLRKELDQNFHAVCRRVAEVLYNNLELFYSNRTFLAKSSNGQVFFYERYAFFDYLNKDGYRIGLSEYQKYKNNIGADVYVKTLFLFGDYLKGDKIKEIKISSKESVEDLHHNLQARLLGIRILLKKENLKSLIQNINDSLKHLSKINTDEEKIKIVFPKFIICEHLLLVGAYEEIYEIIQMTQNYMPREKTVSLNATGLVELFWLFECICLFKMGKVNEAISNFNIFNSLLIDFNVQKYYTIWYLILKEQLVGISKTDQQQMNDLIAETKFYKMKEIYKNF